MNLIEKIETTESYPNSHLSWLKELLIDYKNTNKPLHPVYHVIKREYDKYVREICECFSGTNYEISTEQMYELWLRKIGSTNRNLISINL